MHALRVLGSRPHTPTQFFWEYPLGINPALDTLLLWVSTLEYNVISIFQTGREKEIGSRNSSILTTNEKLVTSTKLTLSVSNYVKLQSGCR